jgi:membrane protease YdiL (CAAX protease family)
VLSPELPFVSWILVGVFIAVTAFLGVRAARKDRREYQRFKRYHSTARRQAILRKWLRESFFVFGGLAVGILLLTWQFLPLLIEDINSSDVVVAFRGLFAEQPWIPITIIASLVLLVVVVPTIALFFVKPEDGDIPSLGDIQAMIPRNVAEVRIGALLSVNAGVVEELLFRLAMPVLLYGAFGSSLFALIASTLLFGGLHAYQGATGILVTMVIGAFMLVLFIATGSILVPIIVHALIDLRSFVLIPLVVLRVQDKKVG